jgi:alpha-mannosidase
MKPTVHLICNAHLDPVWQWRWDEGASEALATFETAAQILSEHPSLVFCHNEAVLYRWVERLDPVLFREIRRLVRARRWAVSGGWYLQPDTNLPGLESVIRQISEGRLYFMEKFGVVPRVAYNFDSFGHGGGLPQILRRAGYRLYIHMRPERGELRLPSDLYRWRGIDGSEILAYRIAVGLYHTEYDNIERRVEQAVELALELERDVPAFWGIGDHGGGATREDLEKIEAFIAREKHVRIVHSTPDRFYKAVRTKEKKAPVFEGDLQRVFTGCYTSLARLKRRAVASLGGLVQAEALGAAAWWTLGRKYPSEEIGQAWRGHLFNDFHDILTGSCVEPAEADAMGLYGRVEDEARRLKLDAAVAFNGRTRPGMEIPVTVLNANPAAARVPVEFEAMISHRPKWSGAWHLRLSTPDGRKISCQEEQPEALLPFNGWRRKVCFMADLTGVGASRYGLRLCEGRHEESAAGSSRTAPSAGASSFPRSRLAPEFDHSSGLVTSLGIGGLEFLAGPMPRLLVIADDGDSWGTGIWSNRRIEGVFDGVGQAEVVERGPVRTITESVFVFKNSRGVLRTIVYPEWPVLEFGLRLIWSETRKRLKLAIPTVFKSGGLLGEIAGGAILRPADGDEHVHGRWCLAEGKIDGKPAALGVVHPGFHGLDFKDGEIRLSVLRSAAYCHEQGFEIEARPVRKFMDLGVHELRFLVTAGGAKDVKRRLAGLADWLAAPPAVYAHLRFGLPPAGQRAKFLPNPGGGRSPFSVVGRNEVLSLVPSNVRLVALKRSWDGEALIVRLHETAGIATSARLEIAPAGGTRLRTQRISLRLKPFEIKTLRIERSGRTRTARLIDE